LLGGGLNGLSEQFLIFVQLHTMFHSVAFNTKYEYKTAQLIVYFAFIFHHKNEP